MIKYIKKTYHFMIYNYYYNRIISIKVNDNSSKKQLIELSFKIEKLDRKVKRSFKKYNELVSQEVK